MLARPGSGIPRRQLLFGMLLVPPALAGCALGRPAGPTRVDPLLSLAAAARADAALGTAAIATDRALTDRVQPLVDARTAHAVALDAEVARLRPGRPTPAPTSAPPVPTPVPLARVAAAARSSADAATTLALELPADRVGLVASIAACCAAYATVLTGAA